MDLEGRKMWKENFPLEKFPRISRSKIWNPRTFQLLAKSNKILVKLFMFLSRNLSNAKNDEKNRGQ